ncbi:MAG: hypothetical protein AB7U49_10250, partial [Hyphomicrobiaceae bacterium]
MAQDCPALTTAPGRSQHSMRRAEPGSEAETQNKPVPAQLLAPIGRPDASITMPTQDFVVIITFFTCYLNYFDTAAF